MTGPVYEGPEPLDEQKCVLSFNGGFMPAHLPACGNPDGPRIGAAATMTLRPITLIPHFLGRKRVEAKRYRSLCRGRHLPCRCPRR